MSQEAQAADGPLLSICIPTYNRADWLELSFKSLLPQIARCDGLAELVISDNASDDRTPEVARAAQSLAPVRYHRNEANIGFMRNMHLLADELARGQFVWLLGDDDIVCEDGVARVLSALQQYPDLDYGYVNYAVWEPDGAPLASLTAAEMLSRSAPRQPDLYDRRVDRLEALIAGDMNCFTPIYCSVMRRPLARRAFEKCVAGEPFSSVESVFPHAQFIAGHLIKKPAWYLGRPCVVSSQETNWSKFWPITILDLVPRLYDEFVRGGADPDVIDRHRRAMLAISGEPLRRMLTQPDTARRRQFSLARFLWKHRRFPEFWTVPAAVCRDVWTQRLPRPVRAALRGLSLLFHPSRLAEALRRRTLARFLRRPPPPAPPSPFQQWLSDAQRRSSVHPTLEMTGLPDGFTQVEIGGEVGMERDITIWMSPDAGAMPRLRIGDRVHIGRNTYLGVFQPVSIGRSSMIGAYSYIISASHVYARRDVPMRDQGFVGAPVVIEEDVWLGTHVVVLPGVTIGQGAIIAAGSIVNKDIPPYEVWGGAPARFLKQRPE